MPTRPVIKPTSWRKRCGTSWNTAPLPMPSADMAMIDAGLKAFSTDKPFVPEAVEWPGVEYT